MVVGGECHVLPALPGERDPILIVQEAGWAPGLVWMGLENLAPARLSSQKWDAVPTTWPTFFRGIFLRMEDIDAGSSGKYGTNFVL